MKKKYIFIILVFSLVIGAIAVITFRSELFGEKPFKELDAAEIESASVRLLPPDKTIQIMENKELAKYLQDIVIYGKDNSYTECTGQTCRFTITKKDGTQIEVTAINPFIIIDGVGYKCKYEPCEALNRYANSLLDE